MALLAPGVAASGIAYAYGPGIDPAWELSQSMAVGDRMVLLVRVLAVFALNTAQLTTWAATAIWAVAAYLVFVGVMFAMYARQGVGGAPPWWWVAVGATAVAAFTAFGFAVGAFWPSRFAAPVAAFGGFLAMAMSSQTGFQAQSGWALILPTNSNGNFNQADSGIFYPWLPDLPIDRIMFLAGIAVAALGLTGLPARAGGRWLRRAAVVVTLAGVASAGTAVGLVSTGQPVAHGVVIPALHDAANDTPVAYTPVCGSAAGVRVCLNPAYRRWLPDVTAALAPALAELTGLLLRGAGIPFAGQPDLASTAENFPRPLPGPVTGPAYVAAGRLAALPAATRNAWLATHLAAIRAGRLTLKDLP